MDRRNPDDFHRIKNQVLTVLPNEYEVKDELVPYKKQFIAGDNQPRIEMSWAETRMAGSWIRFEVSHNGESTEVRCDTETEVDEFLTNTIELEA